MTNEIILEVERKERCVIKVGESIEKELSDAVDNLKPSNILLISDTNTRCFADKLSEKTDNSTVISVPCGEERFNIIQYRFACKCYFHRYV